MISNLVGATTADMLVKTWSGDETFCAVSEVKDQYALYIYHEQGKRGIDEVNNSMPPSHYYVSKSSLRGFTIVLHPSVNLNCA